MKKIMVISAILLSSCPAWFDTPNDISLSLRAPDTLIVKNNSRVSTLRNLECDIYRGDLQIYQFNRDVDLVAGRQTEVTIEDFTIQKGDTVKATDAQLTWSM